MTSDTQDRYAQERHTPQRHDYRFWIGLMAGTAVGAGLVMWLLPHATAELRERATKSANDLRTLAWDETRKASARMRKTGTRVEEAVAAAAAASAATQS